MKADIAGLKIDSLTKQELLNSIGRSIAKGEKIWLTTVYSEFLYAALKNRPVMTMLNHADIAVADGIGILWAQKFLNLPLSAKNFWLKVIQTIWQAAFTLVALPFSQKDREEAGLAEKIPGSELIWDIAKMAAENNSSIFLLGGFGDTPQIASEKLFNIVNGRNLNYSEFIAGYSNKHPNDLTVIDEINKSKPSILFVAYGPIQQEQWIWANQGKLPSVKLFVGLGGTFDYLAGKKANPPKWVRQAGFEWLWRLLTQPGRVWRIKNATFGLVNKLLLFKIYEQMPLRPNAAIVVLNGQGNILICRRHPKPKIYDSLGEDRDKFANYWQLPQGGLHKNESPEEGASREALEETGLNNLKHLWTSPRTHSYRFPLTWARVFSKPFRNRGQTQNIVYFQNLGQDTDVKVDNHEFIDFKWELPENLARTIHSERSNLTEIVVEDLKGMQQKGIINTGKIDPARGGQAKLI